VPDAEVVADYNRFMYARGNPLRYNDPSGHCPAPPKEKGPTICVALFIKPPRVQAGPFTLHGDGRDFSSNSDPSQSRGYAWIGKGRWESSFTRDGFPWAEAYYHDGKGNVQTILQDPAVRVAPHDLFAIEPGMNWKKSAIRFGQEKILRYGKPQISRR